MDTWTNRLTGYSVMLLMLVGGLSCRQLKRTLSRRKFDRATHIARATVRDGHGIVPGSGHVFLYTRLKIKPYVGSHNRIYTHVYLSTRQVGQLPLRRPVSLQDSVVTVAGTVARPWPFDMEHFAGTVTRLSADTLSPVLRLRLHYTLRGDQRTLRRRLVFQNDTAYFQPKK